MLHNNSLGLKICLINYLYRTSIQYINLAGYDDIAVMDINDTKLDLLTTFFLENLILNINRSKKRIHFNCHSFFC